jgi:hypothetical protein
MQRPRMRIVSIAAATLALGASASAAAAQTFHTPTGNVSCRVTSSSAVCTVSAISRTFSVYGSGRGGIFSGRSIGRAAGYYANWGSTIRSGRFVCHIPQSNQTKGVSCRNSVTGHGFEASARASRQKAY